MSAKNPIERFQSARGAIRLFVLEGKQAAVYLLTSNPLAGFCLANNTDIKCPPEPSPLAAARFYVTKPQREILGWLGFRPATEAVAKIGRKCVPESLTIERCRRLRQALRREDIRQLLAHLPRINTGVLALVAEGELLTYLAPQLRLQVAEGAIEDGPPEYIELLRDIHELRLELGHGEPTRKLSSVKEMRIVHQELVEEITRSGGRRYRERQFSAPPVSGITKVDLTITPITNVGGLQTLSRSQHNCVAAYVRSVSNKECYDGNWEAWLKFFLKGVAEVSDAATNTARQILALRESGRRTLMESLGNSVAGHKLFDYLFEQPIITVRLVEQHLDCSYVKANQVVEQFVQAGLLQETTGWKRNRRFRFKPYLDLFEQPQPAEDAGEVD